MTAPGPYTVRLVLPDGDEVDVGTLRVNRGRGRETSLFTYAESYLADPRHYAIDPDLPLTAGPIATGPDRNLFGAMGDSAPDRWGRGLLERAERRAARADGRAARELLDSDFLVGVHDDLRQGALRYRSTSGAYLASTSRGVPRMVDLPRLLSLTERALRDPDLDADLRDLVDAGSSLGGARPKVAVRDHAGVLRIAKFPRTGDGGDEWEMEAWEKLTLDLAADAGITVPRSELIHVAGRQVLLLDRFDRDGDRRVGYVSAMTLLGRTDGTAGVSLAELAEQMEIEAAAPERDLRELYRRGLFGLLVSNTDNHARNHGFLRTAAGWRLSPVFDVNPNPNNPHTFAMPIDPGGSDDLQDAIAAGDAFRLTHHEAVAELRNVLRAVDGWRRKASDLGIDSRDINRMSAAFESSRTEHARRIVERDDADGDTVARRGSSGPQPRQPKGTSTGGRYTTKARTEPNVEL